MVFDNRQVYLNFKVAYNRNMNSDNDWRDRGIFQFVCFFIKTREKCFFMLKIFLDKISLVKLIYLDFKSKSFHDFITKSDLMLT